jgi:putative ABC transport system permease protein
VKHDLRFALRMIASHRWYSAAVIVTLALGIGINTTVFTLVHAVLFKPVPLPNGSRVVTVSGQDLTRADSRRGLSYPDFVELKANNRSFEGLEAITGTRAVLSEAGNTPERYNGQRVTPGLFTLLQMAPIVGRGFLPDDGKAGAPEVALISHTVWKNRYNSDPAIAGRAIRINGAPATIVGVMPEGFKFPQREDVWMPLKPTADFERRTNRPLQVFGVLKPDVTIPSAGADLAVIAQRLATAYPDSNKNSGTIVRTFHDTYNGGPIKTVFLTMLGAVGFVLLIACANVANLMLSRAVAREREIAVRASLGASRPQIIRQLLVESVLLSSLGGILGLGLAQIGVHLFDVATRDVGKPYWIIFSMDYVVFAYFAGISVLSGLLFGLAPALRASRVDLNATLKDGTPGGGGARGGKLTGALVVLQFALTVILLTGAGLMVRSFFAAQQMNPFVPQERILVARLSLPDGKEERYADKASRIRFYEDLVTRLAAAPGVSHAAVAWNPPGLGAGTRDIEIEGKPVEATATPPRASIDVHSPGYLNLIGLPVLQGRAFNETDGDPNREAAIITPAFAAKHWPQQNAVGARFRFLDGRERKPGAWMTVIGVSGEIIQRPQETEPPPLAFLPYRQDGSGGMSILLRTNGDPASLTQTLRSTVQSLDTDLPLFDVRTLTAALERSYWHLVVFGSLFFSFAAIALLMASVGLYAVVAQATARRTREIGIRMALGATAERILQLVLARGLIQLGIGLVLGLGGAFATTQLLTNMRMLGRVSPQDPLVFTLVTLLLIAIGILACWIPARRAAALHPVRALRHE